MVTKGDVVTEIREGIPPFDSLRVYDHLNVFLTQDTFYSVAVKAGKHLIDQVETIVEGPELVIRNHNHCDWFRGYDDEISIYITVDELYAINYSSTGKLTSTNAIQQPWMRLDIADAGGTVALHYEGRAMYCRLLNGGPGDVILNGWADTALFVLNTSGHLNAQAFEVKNALVLTSIRAIGDCSVNVTEELDIQMEGVGSVYYMGNPSVTIQNDGEGGAYEL